MGAALAVASMLLALVATWAAFPSLPVILWRKIVARWRRWRRRRGPQPRVEISHVSFSFGPVPPVEERVRDAERSLSELRKGVRRINDDAARGLTVNMQAVPAALLAILADALAGVESPWPWLAIPLLAMAVVALVLTFRAALRDCLAARVTD